MYKDLGYSYELQTYIIYYRDDKEDRLNKTVEELKKAKEVADSVTGGLSSDYDKVVALNDYFCANASYNYDGMGEGIDTQNPPQYYIDSHTPYGILCDNYGVCESYSEAMALAGRCAGLNVIMETGDLYGAGGHEWNRVQINGQWCILDITNNDNDTIPNGLCNLSDGMIDQLLIPDSTAYLFDASATTDAYEYYRVNNNYADNLDELKSMLKAQLDSGDKAYVRCNSSIADDDVWSVVDQLVSEGYTVSEGYYAFNVVAVSK